MRRSPEFMVRFDALLVHPANLTSRILEAVTTAPNDSLPEPVDLENHSRWSGWGVEGDDAVSLAAMDALVGAADSVYDEMEAELVEDSARGEGYGIIITVVLRKVGNG